MFELINELYGNIYKNENREVFIDSKNLLSGINEQK